MSNTAETSSGQEAEGLGREPTWKRLRWRELVLEKKDYERGFIEETVVLNMKLTAEQKGVPSTRGEQCLQR